MFSDSLILKKDDTLSTTYNRVSVDANASRYLASDSSLSLPVALDIRHSSTARNGQTTDRHNVALSRVVQTTSGPQVVTCNLTIAVPRSAEFTNTIINEEIQKMISFMGAGDGAWEGVDTLSAGMAKLIRGES